MSNKEDKLKDTFSTLGNLWERDSGDENSIQDEKIERSEFTNCYTEGEIIASGGLKEIYKVRDRRTGRDIAMAKLKKEHSSPNNNERFLREARTLAQLEHTNIVPIYEINYDPDDTLFFTMKLLSGETLASILKKIRTGNRDYEKKFPLRRLLGIFIRVCDAMSYAHSKGIIHLDLKPENIQISDFGEVSIIDWGMAKAVSDVNNAGDYNTVDLPDFTPISSSLTMAGNISGTPGFMSPEQARADITDMSEASDIYSLGAILYTIIYHQPPFYKLEIQDVLDKTSEGIQPDFPEKPHGNAVPSALRAVAKKTMMAQPGKRYDSVESLQNDIILYLNDFATQAENINLIKFSSLFIKRHQKSLTIALSFLLIISTITYVYYDEIQKKEEILQAQNFKVNATADEIISGTLQKHLKLRDKYAYDEIISNYEKLRRVGYDYPEFWLDEAKLHIGKTDYKKASKLLRKISKAKSPLALGQDFKKMQEHTERGVKFINQKKLSFERIVDITLNMDRHTQSHTWWELNTDESIPLKSRIERAAKALRRYNTRTDENNFRFDYSIDNGYVKIDISDTKELYQGKPLHGLPMNEIDISGTSIHIGDLYKYFRETLSVLKISNHETHFTNDFIAKSGIHTLIAKNILFSAERLNDASNLKHLDIEGSLMRSRVPKGSSTLEYLNIAFTDIKNLGFLYQCPKLKTLIIDKDKKLPPHIQERLDAQGTKIIVKEEPDQVTEEKPAKLKGPFTIPGVIQAEDYTTMQGISTKEANDEGSGLFVGWIQEGDSMTYHVDIKQSGKYKVTFRLAGFRFLFDMSDNSSKLCNINQDGTGDWQNWTSVSQEIKLQKGRNSLSIYCVGPGWNINWMKFELIE